MCKLVYVLCCCIFALLLLSTARARHQRNTLVKKGSKTQGRRKIGVNFLLKWVAFAFHWQELGHMKCNSQRCTNLPNRPTRSQIEPDETKYKYIHETDFCYLRCCRLLGVDVFFLLKPRYVHEVSSFTMHASAGSFLQVFSVHCVCCERSGSQRQK